MSLNKKIYLVGGAVRDMLMGIPVNDKDYVAVGFTEEEFSFLPKVGKHFPVFLQSDGSELALARVEKKTSSGYNGFSTKTEDVTLEEDLKRRDLTINSIAYDEITNSYIDPYNGQEDIKNKTLKHTSIAFCEDPMRVLRIARFRARFGKEWVIDDSTKALILTMKGELSTLQGDRVYKEIVKVSEYNNFPLFFETLGEIEVLDIVFPSIGKLYKEDKKSFLISMELLEELTNTSLELRFVAIYYLVLLKCHIKLESIVDMKLPRKLQIYIETFLSRYEILFELNNKDEFYIEEFFRHCKRDKKLLEEILLFNKTLLAIGRKHHLCITGELNDDVLLGICNEISSYSPKNWIDSCITKPSNLKILSHVQNYNLQVIRKYKQLYEKPFVF